MSELVSVSVASGTDAPLWSVITPRTEVVPLCPNMLAATTRMIMHRSACLLTMPSHSMEPPSPHTRGVSTCRIFWAFDSAGEQPLKRLSVAKEQLHEDRSGQPTPPKHSSSYNCSRGV